MLEAIDHVCLVVSDLDGMADFYTRLLDMRVTKRVTISGSWIDQTVGLDGVVADVIYLEPPSGPRVELIRYQKPVAARPAGLGDSNLPGIRHLAFRVREIESLVERLRSAGMEFFGEVQKVPTAQVSYGGDVQKRLVYFHDPEGNLLEFCEYTSRTDRASGSSDK
jgi:catechol 2,3-dioxygenase-like lactoylglutathione lyase family enzyme